MRLKLPSCSTHTIGAATSFLMFLHITNTVLLTLTGTDAASLASITNRNRHRSKVRSIRNAQDANTKGGLKESLGERECSEQEKQKQGCLAGSCSALVTSQLHTFVLCRCPSDRQGARCEEIAINTDSIAVELQKQTQDELCKQERYDILAKATGYESLFFVDCVNKNYGVMIGDKKERRARLKKLRDKARKRKFRKRQRKREKKKGLRSSEKSNYLNEDPDTRDNLQQSINTPEHLLLSENEFHKKKDHSGHNHKIRHEVEKSSSRRRRKSLTTFLVGTPTATPLTTPTTRRSLSAH